LLRLLNLAEPVQTMLMAGDVDMGHARALLSLDRATQITAANQITAKKLSVREAEALVKKLSAEFNLTPQKPKAEKSRDLKRVEEELSYASRSVSNDKGVCKRWVSWRFNLVRSMS
jgi:ParB family chromosome partitioning protein